MIRFLFLFLKLRWRLAVGAFRAATAKGGVSTAGAVLSVVAPVVLGFFLLAGAAGLAVAGYATGTTLAGGGAGDRAMALFGLRFALLLASGLLVLMPAIRASRGSSSGDAQTGLTRLLLLPLPRRRLHACEAAASAVDPVLLIFAPGLVALGIGLARSGRPAAGAWTVLSGLALLAALGSLAAVLGMGLQLLLRDRRRAETVLLVALVAWVGLSIVPATIQSIQERRRGDAPAESREEAPPPAPIPLEPELSAEEREAQRTERRTVAAARRSRIAETFPLWLQPLPSEAYARAVARVTQGRPWAALPSLLWLVLFAAACWRVSARLWDRLVTAPPSGGGGEAVDPASLKLRVLPLLAPSTSIIATTTARTFLRTVRGKLAVGLTPLTVAFLGFMIGRGREFMSEVPFFRTAGAGLGSLAVFMSLLSLLPVAANAFASDRAGLTLQALAPVSERRLVWGKTVGGLLLYLPCLALSVLAISLVLGSAPPAEMIATFVSGLAVFWLVAPVATWMSVLLPKQADLGVLTQAGNPHQGAQLVVIVFGGFAMAAAALTGWLGQSLADSAWGAVAAQGLLALLSLLLAWPLLEAAAGALEKRRDVVLSVAQGR